MQTLNDITGEQQKRAAQTEAVRADGLDNRAIEISDKINASAARLEASVILGAGTWKSSMTTGQVMRLTVLVLTTTL